MSDQELKAKIEEVLRRFDPVMAKDAKDLRDALVVMASHVCGADEERIAQITGVDLAHVRLLGERLRVNGVWVGDRLVSDWEGENSGISFVLDLAVAQGHMSKDGDRYSLTPSGVAQAERMVRDTKRKRR